LRAKKTENGNTTYYLRSTVLGGQVVAEIIWVSVSWQWSRGYVYQGSSLLAVQQSGVYWMHEDPVTKSKRLTDSTGAIVSTIELDPWGANTTNRATLPSNRTSTLVTNATVMRAMKPCSGASIDIIHASTSPILTKAVTN